MAKLKIKKKKFKQPSLEDQIENLKRIIEKSEVEGVEDKKRFNNPRKYKRVLRLRQRLT